MFELTAEINQEEGVTESGVSPDFSQVKKIIDK